MTGKARGKEEEEEEDKQNRRIHASIKDDLTTQLSDTNRCMKARRRHRAGLSVFLAEDFCTIFGYNSYQLQCNLSSKVTSPLRSPLLSPKL